ncbi:MAG: TetR/AcrR family transcriptional regulator [Deltaproteobacteria bacterium]|nr:TetR/AcrR family transcriptional regulator [Deltaproteobacteria bacterium]
MSSARDDGRVARAARQRHDRREQVLVCAERVFSRKGYHAAGVADIIAEAGVARGTFYLYFESKRAIFDELLGRLLALLAGSVKRIDVAPGAPPPFEQLLANVNRVVDTLYDHREMTRVLLRTAPGIDADFDRKLEESDGRLRAIIESALATGETMGLVRPCDHELASLCVLGTVKEVMNHYTVEAGGRSVDRRRLARDLLEYNLKGLFR